MDKSERLQVFFRRLTEGKAANTADEARVLLETVLNGVEDEHSGIPYNPLSADTLSMADGRMYPPCDDNERGSTERFRRFRTKGNVVYFGMNGSIRIESLQGRVFVDKPGGDGKTVER